MPSAPPRTAPPSAGGWPARLVPILDVDKDLGRHLDAERAAAARRLAVAPAMRAEAGPWRPPAPAEPEADLGVLVLEGLLWREVTFGKRTFSELVGTGDLLRPWQLEDYPADPAKISWSAVGGAELAYLDRRCSAVIGRFPEVMAALMERSVRRSRSLALQVAICHQRRVDIRLHQILWLLSTRWGRVTPDGVVVNLRVTHEVLGRLVGARRPSVTTALNELIESGAVSRRADGGWLLRGDAPEGFTAPGQSVVVRPATPPAE